MHPELFVDPARAGFAGADADEIGASFSRPHATRTKNGIASLSVKSSSPEINSVDRPHIGDVIEGISIQYEQVGDFAFGQCAELLVYS